MRWAEGVAWRGEIKMQTKFWSEDVMGRDHSEDLGVDGRVIINWIFGK
jgi:hypothetical protein